MPAAARPLRVQAVQKQPSARSCRKHREDGETQQASGIATVPTRSANAPASPVTPEVAGSSPVAPAPSTSLAPIYAFPDLVAAEVEERRDGRERRAAHRGAVIGRAGRRPRRGV